MWAVRRCLCCVRECAVRGLCAHHASHMCAVQMLSEYLNILSSVMFRVSTPIDILRSAFIILYELNLIGQQKLPVNPHSNKTAAIQMVSCAFISFWRLLVAVSNLWCRFSVGAASTPSERGRETKFCLSCLCYLLALEIFRTRYERTGIY